MTALTPSMDILLISIFAMVGLLLILALAYVVEPGEPSPLSPVRLGVRRWLLRGIAIGIIANAFAPAILTLMAKGWMAPLPAAPAMVTFAAFLAVPVSAFWEEVVYRGYILRWLQPLGTVFSITFSSLLFVSIHFLAEPFYVERFLILFSMGVLLGVAYLASGSLWFSIGIHVGINTVGFILVKDIFAGGLWHFVIDMPPDTFLMIALVGIALGAVLAGTLPHSRRRSTGDQL